MSSRENKSFILTPEILSEQLFIDAVYAGLAVLTLRDEMSRIIAAPPHYLHSTMAAELQIDAALVAFAGRIFRGARHGNDIGFDLGGHSIQGFDPSYHDIEPREAFRDSLNAMLAAIGRGVVIFE